VQELDGAVRSGVAASPCNSPTTEEVAALVIDLPSGDGGVSSGDSAIPLAGGVDDSPVEPSASPGVPAALTLPFVEDDFYHCTSGPVALASTMGSGLPATTGPARHDGPTMKIGVTSAVPSLNEVEPEAAAPVQDAQEDDLLPAETSA